ncbi:hypothetical protein RSOLAG1IB_06546 [Rhizoctonia solani AG-1 IB]|uniref:Uncharacterized protein n=1 Tax=Thanatephorus cucumeris (strain AG1-IB / isolate 7/3/14) TaxID=1108050 RepID=A0A0B7F885_THACB|nr:hypothetical protein RSOLAG1IB_06546 [Rhizoctonia solani AG-1 IB]
MDSNLGNTSNLRDDSPPSHSCSPERRCHDATDVTLYDEGVLPPSYESTVGHTTPVPNSYVNNIANNTSSPTFRPPPLNQLTLEDANKTLESADRLWSQGKWDSARTRYTTAAAIFYIVEDKRNEAYCFQRLGEVCRIGHDFKAARAHLWKAHVLFGRCGEIARQLMCERWIARVASDEGLEDEARLILHSALDHSRAFDLRESEGWCLLRLGELEKMNETLIQQALVVAQEENIELLERRCTFGLLQIHGIRASKATVIVESPWPKDKDGASEGSAHIGVTNDPGKGKGKEKPLPESKFDSDISQFKDIQAESVSINTSAVGSSSSRFDGIRTAAKRWKSWFEKD